MPRGTSGKRGLQSRGGFQKILAKFLGIESAGLQKLCSKRFLFVSEAQQQVLRTDMAMVQTVCFFGRVFEDTSGLVVERQVSMSRDFLLFSAASLDFTSD